MGKDESMKTQYCQVVGGGLLIAFTVGVVQHAEAERPHTLANTFASAAYAAGTSAVSVVTARLVYSEAVEVLEDTVSKYITVNPVTFTLDDSGSA